MRWKVEIWLGCLLTGIAACLMSVTTPAAEPSEGDLFSGEVHMAYRELQRMVNGGTNETRRQIPFTELTPALQSAQRFIEEHRGEFSDEESQYRLKVGGTAFLLWGPECTVEEQVTWFKTMARIVKMNDLQIKQLISETANKMASEMPASPYYTPTHSLQQVGPSTHEASMKFPIAGALFGGFVLFSNTNAFRRFTPARAAAAFIMGIIWSVAYVMLASHPPDRDVDEFFLIVPVFLFTAVGLLRVFWMFIQPMSMKLKTELAIFGACCLIGVAAVAFSDEEAVLLGVPAGLYGFTLLIRLMRKSLTSTSAPPAPPPPLASSRASEQG